MFFEIKFSKWVFKIRYAMVLIAAIIFGLNAWGMSTLQTANRPEAVLKNSNPMEKALIWARYELWQDATIGIDYNWGI